MLTPDMIQFLRDVGGGILCTRDADNRPSIVECLYVEIGEDQLVGLVPPYLPTGDLLGNLADNAEFALITSRVPGDHRSIQVKGHVTDWQANVVTPDEVRTALALPTQRYPGVPESLDLSRFEDLVDLPVHRLEFRVEEVFDQTPGPNAGNPVQVTT